MRNNIGHADQTGSTDAEHGRIATKLYFAYGSNLWLEQMQRRCPHHRIIGVGRLDGYRWIISKRGYANIVKSVPDEVQGVVYKLTAVDERNLDDHEGVDNGSYRKKMMSVQMDDKAHCCLVYVDPIEEEGKPKPEYIERINNGISTSRLSAEYIDRYVRKFIPAESPQVNR